jgi:hypothetical protein
MEGTGINLANSSQSIAMWVKSNYVSSSTTGGEWLMRVGAQNSAGKSTHVVINYGSYSGYSFFYDDFHQNETVVSDAQWHHVVCTYSSSTNGRVIYVDGQSVATNTAVRGFSGDDYFAFLMENNVDVDLDDVRFYNRVLSDLEVSDLFQAEGFELRETTLSLAVTSDTGSSDSDRITKLTQPEIIGTTDPGVMLELSSDIDGALGSATADGSGNWSLEPAAAMSEGVHEITVTSGGTAEPLTITIDTTAPDAPPIPVLSATSDTGPSNNDAYTADNTPTLTGEAEAGAAVALTSNLDGVVGTGTASSSWSITANILQDGIHSLTATATDVAGNESAASPALSVTIDTTAPTVTVNQATGQNDPAAAGPIAFTAAFSEDVTGFDSSDVSVGGSVGGTPTVAGGPATYTVYVVTSSDEGTVNVTVGTSAAIDLAGNSSNASTSNDNRVTLDFHGNGSANATPLLLTAGIGSKSGWVEEGDVDAFTFTLAEPRIAMIYTTGAVDTRGELSDALGTTLNNPSSDDDSGDGTNFQIVQPLPAGSYTVIVAANSGEGDYDLFIKAVDTPRIQPDLVIVKGLDNLIGDGLYTSLVGQRLTLVSRNARSVRAIIQAQNDGEIRDIFRLGANRSSSWFQIHYVSPIDGNVSAELASRTLETQAIDPEAAPYEIEMTAKPIKRKIRKKIRRRGRRTSYRWLSKNFTARFSAISTSAETQRDDCVIGVKTK